MADPAPVTVLTGFMSAGKTTLLNHLLSALLHAGLFVGRDRPVAVHGVQHLFHPPALLTAWPDGDPQTSRLVFITRELPRDVIEEGLRAFSNAAVA